MLSRTISVSNPGRPEFVGTDDDGNPIVQFVYDIDIEAALATILPRDVVWQWWPPGPASYSSASTRARSANSDSNGS